MYSDVHFHDAFPITPDDGADLPKHAHALTCSKEGSLHAKGRDGNEFTLVHFPANTLVPIHIIRVYATGTTAKDLTGYRGE